MNINLSNGYDNQHTRINLPEGHTRYLCVYSRLHPYHSLTKPSYEPIPLNLIPRPSAVNNHIQQISNIMGQSQQSMRAPETRYFSNQAEREAYEARMLNDQANVTIANFSNLKHKQPGILGFTQAKPSVALPLFYEDAFCAREALHSLLSHKGKFEPNTTSDSKFAYAGRKYKIKSASNEFQQPYRFKVELSNRQ